MVLDTSGIEGLPTLKPACGGTITPAGRSARQQLAAKLCSMRPGQRTEVTGGGTAGGRDANDPSEEAVTGGSETERGSEHCIPAADVPHARSTPTKNGSTQSVFGSVTWRQIGHFHRAFGSEFITRKPCEDQRTRWRENRAQTPRLRTPRSKHCRCAQESPRAGMRGGAMLMGSRNVRESGSRSKSGAVVTGSAAGSAELAVAAGAAPPTACAPHRGTPATGATRGRAEATTTAASRADGAALPPPCSNGAKSGSAQPKSASSPGAARRCGARAAGVAASARQTDTRSTRLMPSHDPPGRRASSSAAPQGGQARDGGARAQGWGSSCAAPATMLRRESGDGMMRVVSMRCTSSSRRRLRVSSSRHTYAPPPLPSTAPR